MLLHYYIEITEQKESKYFKQSESSSLLSYLCFYVSQHYVQFYRTE